VVAIRYDLFLNRGDCPQRDVQCEVDLRKRETIAGLRYGLEGMRVGGRRRIRVPPHLAYGDEGTAFVPARALLIFEVEVVSRRDSDE
jgi:FKBP-type peptidyl-prolyl cis-trans isomerase